MLYSDTVKRCHRCRTLARRHRGRSFSSSSSSSSSSASSSSSSTPVVHAEQYCYQCQQPLCRQCHATLHCAAAVEAGPAAASSAPQRGRRRRRRHHLVVPLLPTAREWVLSSQLLRQQGGGGGGGAEEEGDDDEPAACPAHEGQPLAWFCVTCRQALCGLCAESEGPEHAGHDLWDVGTSLRNAGNTLRGRLALMEEHREALGGLLGLFRSLDHHHHHHHHHRGSGRAGGCQRPQPPCQYVPAAAADDDGCLSWTNSGSGSGSQTGRTRWLGGWIVGRSCLGMGVWGTRWVMCGDSTVKVLVQ